VSLEKAGLGEQALNRIAEMALASQLPEVERLEVQIKTDLSKLAHGEVEAIAIKINGLVTQQNLCVEELQLQIGRVIVKPRSAIFGKIKLTQRSTGTLRIIINQKHLTRVFNSKSFHQSVKDKQGAIHLQQVKFELLADGNIAFNSQLILEKTGAVQPVAFTATPRIEADGQGIVLQDVLYSQGKELPSELTAALVAQVSEVLSLHDLQQNFQQKGMSLRIQQVDIAAGKLMLQAAAYIEQFPSS
jgi:hypothetical protein